ncbi:hypothetical protein TRAPUB_11579 [Trametes pubescens]|uniref:Uncharacterized protein n=1 Tax=Trametes pubescens TaxID=154538 RepID=A0A1M2VWH6_TRAPU|nr:hypothetical protein TRAPUB_11579 [Trametes pubescens]
MSQRCETTQGGPAPFGPREQAGISRTCTALPTTTREYTAPPATCNNEREAMPWEKFHDVLHEPVYYSLMYPKTLPLTQKIYLQRMGQGPLRDVVMAASDTTLAQEQQQPFVPPDILGRQFFAELTAASDLDVEHTTRGRKRPLSPPATKREGMLLRDIGLNAEPAPFPGPLGHVVKDTQWTKPQADDIVQPGTATNWSRRPLPPIGAEVRPSRSRSRSPNIPRESFRGPRYDPRSSSGPLEHIKNTQWTTWKDDVVQAGSRANKGGRPLPPIGAEVRPARSRSRSRSPRIPRGSFHVPRCDPELSPTHSPSDDEDDDEDEPPGGYEPRPTTLDIAERGEWLRTPLGHPAKYGAMPGTGYTPRPRESALPPACGYYGRTNSWGSEV